MRTLGLSYDDVRALNPRVVYASASGFGQDGPLADRPGLDIMAQARGGLMSITGDARRGAREDRRARRPIWSAPCTRRSASWRRCASGTGAAQGSTSTCRSSSRLCRLAVWEAGRFFATGEVGRAARLGSSERSALPSDAKRRRLAHAGCGHPENMGGALSGARAREHAGRRAVRELVAAPRPPRRATSPSRGAEDDADDGRDIERLEPGRLRAPRSPTTAKCSTTRTSRRAISFGTRRTGLREPFDRSARHYGCPALRRGAVGPADARRPHTRGAP